MSQLIKAQQAIGAGDLKSARNILNHHLRHRPQDPDGLYLLGICEQAGGNPAAAKDLYARILRLDPAHFGAHYNLALLLSNAGRDAEALPHHDASVRLQPGQFWPYINRGNARARLGQYESAIDDYREGLKIDPRVPEAWTNMGNALREAAQLEDSLQAHEQALRLRESYAEAWANKAATLIAMKRPEQALDSVQTALGLAPLSADAWSIRGAALLAKRRFAEAIASYDRALQLRPDHAPSWLNRGNALSDTRHYPAAIESYDQALKIDPRQAQAWFYRGMTLKDMKSFEEALRSFEAALRLEPELDRALGVYLRTKMQICDWRNLDDDLSRLVGQIRAGKSAGTPFGVIGLSGDPALQRLASELHARQLHPPQHVPGPIPRRQPGDRIRLGYYSADFRNHPVAQLLVELIELHDRSKFEVVAFSFGPDAPSPLRQRLAQAFDRFIDVDAQSDAEVVQLSRGIGVDIAIDLGGYTDGARPDIFAMRAAPIQAGYLGYAGTMGADYMDYLIADAVVCPAGSDAYYTEKLARLPHCFMPHDGKQDISAREFQRRDFGLPEAGFVYCCFNNHNKITPEVFDVWMRLLEQVPGSVLWLSDGNPLVKSNLAREASARGVDPARLMFAPRLDSMAEHLARLRLADLFIDTQPYNAHTTACDALWAGVPVLTCMGQSFASRVAGSLLHTVGLPALVTSSPGAYEAMALELARNPARLSAMRQKLAESRLTSPLFDTRQLAKDLEQLYATMYERSQAGLDPQSIDGASSANPSAHDR